MTPKNHFALNRNSYKAGLISGFYNNTWRTNLSVKAIPPTFENLEPLMDKLSEKWGWKNQERYSEEALRHKLSQTGSAIYLLQDDDESVGYALVSVPPPNIKDRFYKASNDVNIIEIDNLGLNPNQEGGGRGKAYFEMMFDKYFPDYDVVYWTQHETHSPTLARFYKEKLGMTLLAQDMVDDFYVPAIQEQRHLG